MKKSALVLFLLVIGFDSLSQKKPASAPVQKKVLTHSVYDSWKEISYKALTPDGNFAAFTVNPQDGDGKVVFYNLKTAITDSVLRAENVLLTFDSRYGVFKIKPPQKVVKDLRRQKKKKEDLPKDSLGIYSFVTRKTEKVPDVRSYKIPEKSAGWIAYQLEPLKEVKPKTDDKAKTEIKKTRKKKINSDENGLTLVLRKLGEEKTTAFGFVRDYSFAKYGQGLLFASGGNDSTMKAGVYWYDLHQQKLQLLYEGKSKHKMKGLAISEDGTQASFLVDADTTKAPVRHFQLYHWKAGNPSATMLDVEHSMAIPQNWTVSENNTPSFAKDGLKLFFGSAPIPVMQDTTLLPEEIVSVEVWHGEDDYIYPQQNKQVDSERKRSYQAFIDLPAKQIVQLADREVPTIELGEEGNANVALGETNIPYRKMTTWDPSAYNDLYIFDLKTHQRKPIATRIKETQAFHQKQIMSTGSACRIRPGLPIPLQR
ncbi:MAG: S9 family peptidase, partial [Bacteroidota bacterium]